KSDKNSQIDSLKKELLEFISSSNIYYSAHQKEVENLLAKLENHSNVNNEQNTSKNPENFP
ncbi:14102_t:CDS:1, partial [Funneliformis geosporum]